MSIRDDFFAAQAKASLWDVAVSIKRGNPLPLDANAVYSSYGVITKTEMVDGVEKHTYTAGSLLEYAKTNPVAYPGQICAVVEENATTIYYLDQNLEIRQVGIIPSGDEASIDVDETGYIVIHNFEGAAENTVAMKEGGEIVWKTLEEIGAGDGNTKSVVVADSRNDRVEVVDNHDEQSDTHTYTVTAHDYDYRVSAEAGDGTLNHKLSLPWQDGMPNDYEVRIYTEDQFSHYRVLGSDGQLFVQELSILDGTRIEVKVGNHPTGSQNGVLELYIQYGDYSSLTVLVNGEPQVSNEAALKVPTLEKVEEIPETATKEYHTEAFLSTEYYKKGAVDNAIKVVADLVGVPAEDDESTDTLYERIAAEILRATNAESALSDRIGVKAEGETEASGVYAYVDGVVNALVNGVDPEKIDSLNELIAWVEAHPDIVSGLDERLLKVEGALDGIGGEEEPETVVEAIEEAITAHEGVADGKYATKQEIADAGYAVAANVERDYAKKATTLAGYGIADAYTKTEIDNKIGTPGVPAEKDEEGNETTPAIPGTGVYEHIYSKSETLNLIETINGGATAGQVEAELKDYKTSNDARVDAVEEKLEGIEEGAEVNIIEIVKVNGTALEPDSQRAVNIEISSATLSDSATLLKSISDAQAQADKGVQDAKKVSDDLAALTTSGQVAINTGDIATLKGLVGSNNDYVEGGEVKTTLAYRVGALEAHDAAHTIEFNTLSGKVDQNIADIAKKADKETTYTKGEVDALILPSALNVYTKTEADGKFLAKADYTPYDDTAVKGLITAEENRAKGEEARIEGLVTAEVGRATAEEARIVGLVEYIYKAGEGEAKATGRLVDLEDRVDGIDALLNTVSSEDSITSLKELAIWVEEHETEVLPVIEQLGKDVDALELAVDAIIQPKESAEISVATDGTLGIKEMNVNKLVQTEGEELILNGGNASLAKA